MLTRRSFLLGAIAAPAVVRAESLMRVKAIVLPGDPEFVTATEITVMWEELMTFGTVTWNVSKQDRKVNWIRPGLSERTLRALRNSTGRSE